MKKILLEELEMYLSGKAFNLHAWVPRFGPLNWKKQKSVLKTEDPKYCLYSSRNEPLKREILLMLEIKEVIKKVSLWVGDMDVVQWSLFKGQVKDEAAASPGSLLEMQIVLPYARAKADSQWDLGIQVLPTSR